MEKKGNKIDIKARLEYLEEMNRIQFFALDLLTSLGTLHGDSKKTGTRILFRKPHFNT